MSGQTFFLRRGTPKARLGFVSEKAAKRNDGWTP